MGPFLLSSNSTPSSYDKEPSRTSSTWRRVSPASIPAAFPNKSARKQKKLEECVRSDGGDNSREPHHHRNTQRRTTTNQIERVVIKLEKNHGEHQAKTRDTRGSNKHARAVAVQELEKKSILTASGQPQKPNLHVHTECTQPHPTPPTKALATRASPSQDSALRPAWA